MRELLTHYSGLAPDLDLKAPWQGRDTAFTMAMQQTPANPPGSRFVYSDINFEVLGFLVEKVSGMPLNEFAERNVFEPLGMTHTRFLAARRVEAAHRAHAIRRTTAQCCAASSTIPRRGAWAGLQAMRVCSPPPTISPSSRRK